MKLYLVRHGESEGNRSRTYQFPDSGLSDTGRRQAEVVAKRIKNIPIDFIYSSNLVRAVETAGLIADAKGVKVETWQDVSEIRRPSALHGMHVDSAESKNYEKALAKNFINDPDWKFSDDESFNELKSRATKVLNHILEKHKGQNVLVVSHGTFIKMLLSVILFRKKLTPEIFWDFRHHSLIKNTGISICEYNKGRGWSVLSLNDMSHL